MTTLTKMPHKELCMATWAALAKEHRCVEVGYREALLTLDPAARKFLRHPVVKEAREVVANRSARQKVLTAVAAGHVKMNDISAASGVYRATVGLLVKRMAEVGDLTRTPDPKPGKGFVYSLPPKDIQ